MKTMVTIFVTLINCFTAFAQSEIDGNWVFKSKNCSSPNLDIIFIVDDTFRKYQADPQNEGQPQGLADMQSFVQDFLKSNPMDDDITITRIPITESSNEKRADNSREQSNFEPDLKIHKSLILSNNQFSLWSSESNEACETTVEGSFTLNDSVMNIQNRNFSGCIGVSSSWIELETLETSVFEVINNELIFKYQTQNSYQCTETWTQDIPMT